MSSNKKSFNEFLNFKSFKMGRKGKYLMELMNKRENECLFITLYYAHASNSFNDRQDLIKLIFKLEID